MNYVVATPEFSFSYFSVCVAWNYVFIYFCLYDNIQTVVGILIFFFFNSITMTQISCTQVIFTTCDTAVIY